MARLRDTSNKKTKNVGSLTGTDFLFFFTFCFSQLPFIRQRIFMVSSTKFINFSYTLHTFRLASS